MSHEEPGGVVIAPYAQEGRQAHRQDLVQSDPSSRLKLLACSRETHEARLLSSLRALYSKSGRSIRVCGLHQLEAPGAGADTISRVPPDQGKWARPMLQDLSQDPHKGAQGRESRAEGAGAGTCVGSEIRRESVLLGPGGQSSCRWQAIFRGRHSVLGPHLELARYSSEIYTVPFSGHLFSVQSLPEPPWAPGTRSSGPSEAGPTLQG